MVRRSAALVLLTALAGVGHACPWWGRPSHPGPVVVYPYCPPPVVVYHPCPPPVIVYQPAPAPAEPPKAAAPEPPAAVEKELDPEALYERAVRSCVYLVTP